MVWHSVILGLGSNLGPSLHLLQAAWAALQKVPEVVPCRLSSPYRSRPVDMASPHCFINAVGLICTSLGPLALLHLLQSLETSYGRRRDPLVRGYQDRSLDLDLLLYDDLHHDTSELIIPHPRMGQRRFVLDPLLEIIDGEHLSPFTKSLPDWARACRSNLGDQAIERLAWPDAAAAFALQPLEKFP